VNPERRVGFLMTMTMTKPANLQWKEIVRPLPRADAELAFAHWKQAHPEESAGLRPDDIKIDIIRDGRGKTLMRYSIRDRGGAVQ
jgi:hypothetical protein